jgi:hypothetical protein
LAEKLTTEELLAIFFADDLALASNDIEALKRGLKKLEEWCRENGLQVNAGKTKMMRFSKGGGRYAIQDRLLEIDGNRIEVVREFKYLGVTFQPRMSFSKHISEKLVQARAIVWSLGKLEDLDLRTAMRVFRMKVLPVITYCLTPLVKWFKLRDLKELDRIKYTFLKGILGLGKFTSSTLAGELCGETTLVRELERMGYEFSEGARNEYEEFRELRNLEFVIKRFSEGPAFESNKWREAKQKNRRIVTRITAVLRGGERMLHV